MARRTLEDEKIPSKRRKGEKVVFALFAVLLVVAVLWLNRGCVSSAVSRQPVVGVVTTELASLFLKSSFDFAFRERKEKELEVRLFDRLRVGLEGPALVRLIEGGSLSLEPNTIVYFRPGSSGLDAVVFQGAIVVNGANVNVIFGVEEQKKAEPQGTRSKRFRPVLGVNVAGLSDYSAESPFIDLFRYTRRPVAQAVGRPWGEGEKLALTPRGYVSRLLPGQFADMIIVGADRSIAPGAYALQWKGRGTLELFGEAKELSRRPNLIQVAIPPKMSFLAVRMRAVDVADPARDFTLVPWDDRAKASPTRLDRRFLDRWRGVSAIRFMEWMQQSDAPTLRWEDRVLPSAYSYSQGVPIEQMLEVAKELDADPWLCIPHQADDGYVRGMAELVAANLPPNRRVYVEYSNEVWSQAIPAGKYAARQGLELGLSSDPGLALERFYGMRAVQVFRIWEKAFAGRKGLLRVFGAQSANPGLAKRILEKDGIGAQGDLLAIAPYFGQPLGNPDKHATTLALGLDGLMRQLELEVESVRAQVASHREIAAQFDLGLVAYEGGQHLAIVGPNNEKLGDLFSRANRDPRIERLYDRYMKLWSEVGGGIMVHYATVGASARWGNFGLLENYEQDPQKAPKYRAFRRALGTMKDGSERDSASVAPPSPAAAPVR